MPATVAKKLKVSVPSGISQSQVLCDCIYMRFLACSDSQRLRKQNCSYLGIRGRKQSYLKCTIINSRLFVQHY